MKHFIDAVALGAFSISCFRMRSIEWCLKFVIGTLERIMKNVSA